MLPYKTTNMLKLKSIDYSIVSNPDGSLHVTRDVSRRKKKCETVVASVGRKGVFD